MLTYFTSILYAEVNVKSIPLASNAASNLSLCPKQ